MKFGVREICDVVLKAKSNIRIGSHVFQKGEPVIYFDTAKTSSMESASTTVYAQGGRGNSRLIAWEGEKTLTFTMEDALISPKGLAILSGADLIQASDSATSGFAKTIIAHKTEIIEVKENNQFELTEVASDNTDIYFMLLDNNGEMSGTPVKVTSSKGKVASGPQTSDNKKITATGLVNAGDIIMVDYYADHKTDAMQIDITPDQFAGYYYLEASTLFRRESDGADLPAEIIIPKVKIQSNFTFTMASSGDPSSFTFTMDAFPDYTIADQTKKVLATIQVLGADDNFDPGGQEKLIPADVGDYKRVPYGTDKPGVYLSEHSFTADEDGTFPSPEAP